MAYWSTPGVFNVLDPWAGGTAGMVAGATVSYTQAVANAEILQAAIWAAQIASATSCGSLVVAGEVVIPGHSIVPPPVNPGGTGDAGAIYLLAIPPVNAAFNAAIVINCNWPVLIRGTGNVKLEMMLDSNHNSGDMFYLQTSEGDNTGGITFEDLILAYPSIPNQTSTMYWSAVHTATLTLGGSDGGAENVRLNRVALLDCPIGCWFEMALQPSLLNCSISWASNFGIGVMLGDGINGGASAKEVYIAGCVFEVSAMNAPSGQTAIQIGACDHVRVENCQIDGVSYGIIITPGAGPGSTSPPLVTPVNAVHLSFTGVNVYCANKPSGAQGMACVVQPATANQAVAQIVFQGCTFELSDTAHPATGGPGILVDGKDQSTVDSIRFVSCYSCQWAGPGLMITGGATNIEVIGGMYAGNKYQDVATQSYGIYIGDTSGEGTVTGVRIVGACCVGSYKVVTLKTVSASGTQATGIYIDSGASDVIIQGCDVRDNSQYGIYVKGNASDIIIDSCDARGNTTNGILVDGSSTAVTNIFVRNCNASGYSSYSTAIYVLGPVVNLSTVEITNCAGYNDQGKVFTPALTSGSTFYPYNLGYWGPIEFYIANGSATIISSITVDGTVIPLKSGSVLLVPGESASITWTPTFLGIDIVAIGK